MVTAMARWFTHKDSSQIQLVLINKTPLISTVSAILTLADGHKITLDMTLKYTYHRRGESKHLSSIHIDDLFGNGDTTPHYRNQGYGSSLVATCLKFIRQHQRISNNEACEVTGKMVPCCDTSPHSSSRRAAFWQKMGMDLKSKHQAVSEFSGELNDPQRERYAWRTDWHSAIHNGSRTLNLCHSQELNIRHQAHLPTKH